MFASSFCRTLHRVLIENDLLVVLCCSPLQRLHAIVTVDQRQFESHLLNVFVELPRCVGKLRSWNKIPISLLMYRDRRSKLNDPTNIILRSIAMVLACKLDLLRPGSQVNRSPSCFDLLIQLVQFTPLRTSCGAACIQRAPRQYWKPANWSRCAPALPSGLARSASAAADRVRNRKPG